LATLLTTLRGTIQGKGFALLSIMVLGLYGCSSETPAPDAASVEEDAEAMTNASPEASGDGMAAGTELPTRKIPNIPSSAEAYYAADNLHIIANVQDSLAIAAGEGEQGGALTYTFTDQGENIRRINDTGQSACAFFFPDQTRLVWTSTKDRLDMPRGNWSDSTDYPQGSELYISDLDGGNIQRLTDNEYYEAEVSISPDGKWIIFGRQIDGMMDLWRMRSDGTGEEQITFTPDWQEGAPFYLPDNETILMRAWRASDYKVIRPTPMTVFTIKHDGSERTPRTFDRDMNWAPFPAPDGRHYGFVRVLPGNNWEIFLGDLEGGEPVRLTYNDSFDGFPAFSPDGTKMIFARSEGEHFMSGLYTYVMDVSSLNLGPENYKGVPGIVPPASAGE